MSTPPRLALHGLVLLVAIVGSGCGKDECEKIYEMETKCSERKKAPDKDLFVAACKLARNADDTKDELDGMAACAKQDSCDAFKACGLAQRGKRRAKEVTKAIGEGKWKDAFDDCTLNDKYYADPQFKAECMKVFTTGAPKITGEDLSSAMMRCRTSDDVKKVVPELGKACSEMAKTQLTAASETARKARDKGERDFKACMDLERVAEMAGGDAVAGAKTLCKEVELAEDAKKAIDAATANIAAKKSDTPYQCDSVAKLTELGTEWSKKKADEVMKVCHVDLAKIILEVDGASASKYVCPYRIKRVMDTATKHDLAAKYPDLAEALTKVPKSCKK